MAHVSAHTKANQQKQRERERRILLGEAHRNSDESRIRGLLRYGREKRGELQQDTPSAPTTAQEPTKPPGPREKATQTTEKDRETTGDESKKKEQGNREGADQQDKGKRRQKEPIPIQDQSKATDEEERAKSHRKKQEDLSITPDALQQEHMEENNQPITLQTPEQTNPPCHGPGERPRIKEEAYRAQKKTNETQGEKHHHGRRGELDTSIGRYCEIQKTRDHKDENKTKRSETKPPKKEQDKQNTRKKTTTSMGEDQAPNPPEAGEEAKQNQPDMPTSEEQEEQQRQTQQQAQANHEPDTIGREIEK